MKRIERARIVRDTILAIPREQWRWSGGGNVRFFEVSRYGWNASLHTRFNPMSGLPEAKTYQQAMLLQEVRILPNLLDVWTQSLGKILSVEWDDTEIHLISMKRGDWEADLFGLPAYVKPRR